MYVKKWIITNKQCDTKKTLFQHHYLRTEKKLPDTKIVTHTNHLDLAWRLDRRTGRLIVMSSIDNLIKGAGGQAIQSFNIMCGFDETLGLI